MPKRNRRERQTPKQRHRRKWYQEFRASIDRMRARDEKNRSGERRAQPEELQQD